MTLDDIEAEFERKDQMYQRRIKELQKEKVVPLTLRLIYKHAFVQEVKEPGSRFYDWARKEAGDDVSQRTESTDATKKEGKGGGQEEEDDDDSGPEDNEAFVIQEKKKIQDALRESQTSFAKRVADSQGKPGAKKPVAPTITRRLGVGLAAIVKAKVLARHQAQ